MLKLDKRLQAILAEVDCDTLADVGCDHGKISAMALILHKANAVFALDISEKSLQKVCALKKEYNLANLAPLVSDGLAALRAPCDQVVIAGLGGNEIVKIINNANYYGKMVLVPHQDADVLRQFISGKVAIIKDYYVQVGGKFYPIIVTEKGSDCYLEEEYSYGKNLPKSVTYTNMLKERRTHFAKYVALNGVSDTKLNKCLAEVTELCQKLEI